MKALATSSWTCHRSWLLRSFASKSWRTRQAHERKLSCSGRSTITPKTPKSTVGSSRCSFGCLLYRYCRTRRTARQHCLVLSRSTSSSQTSQAMSKLSVLARLSTFKSEKTCRKWSKRPSKIPSLSQTKLKRPPQRLWSESSTSTKWACASSKSRTQYAYWRTSYWGLSLATSW